MLKCTNSNADGKLLQLISLHLKSNSLCLLKKDRKKILSYFVSIPNSFNCAGSTGLGACAIKSDALAVLGNATTSRMLSVPAKIIVKRSRPIPTPP